MSESSPVPIFDGMTHFANSYQKAWREDHPGYHKRYREKQFQMYGHAVCLKRERERSRKQYESMSPEKKEIYLIKHREADKKRYKLNKIKKAHAEIKRRKDSSIGR